MISPDRVLLQQEIYNFLRTLSIKFEPTAHYINTTLLKKNYVVNEQDPASWKYYLNLVGEYHVSDTKMYVTSLDTRETILFSPETLSKHLRTKAAYKPGSKYYTKLCALFPSQVDLIKSILFPVESIEKAITAEDFTLLQFGSGYLEEYEEAVLVDEVSRFLAVYKERWYFDFLDDEPLFYITAWGTLWTYLAMLLMSARVSHVNTPYVHSWDIWNALEAKGISNYSDILDRKKSMTLYQSIDYFKTNAGKQSNLLILAEKLLSSFGIGLYGRIVVQEAETGAEDYQLTPQLVPLRLPSREDVIPAAVEIKKVSTVQSEIFKKGLTASNQAEVVKAVERKLGDTTLNEYATKFLEIKPIAQHKPYSETLNMFLLETLVVSIKNGYYSNPVEVIDPLTSSPIYLSPGELLALYHYALTRSMGITAVNFPTQVNLYRSFLPQIGTPAKTLMRGDEKIYISAQVDSAEYLSGLEYDRFIRDPKDFSDNMTALWLRYMDHLVADQSTSLDKRSYVYSYLSTLCHTRRQESMQLVKGYKNYEDWLGPSGIDIHTAIFDQYKIQPDPDLQWANLADTIMSTLVPVNETLKIFGNFTLSNFGYERLRQLFVQMCSYRVVFLESERDNAEFSPGPKWSNYHGPDDIDQYGDFIITFEQQNIDHSLVTRDMLLHGGFKQERLTAAKSKQNYTVTTTATMIKQDAVQFAEAARSFSANKSVVTASGTLGMTRNLAPSVNNPD